MPNKRKSMSEDEFYAKLSWLTDTAETEEQQRALPYEIAALRKEYEASSIAQPKPTAKPTSKPSAPATKGKLPPQKEPVRGKSATRTQGGITSSNGKRNVNPVYRNMGV